MSSRKENFLPIVALVGPVNAGKSTLFNRLAGDRLAVTSSVPGTTRDRQYAEILWNNQRFNLVDTAGLLFRRQESESDVALEKNVVKQIGVAKKEAEVLVFVVDGRLDAATVDRKVLLEFRKAGKPVILAINKIDSPKVGEEILGKFAKLGIKPSFSISSLTGRGTGDLLDAIVKNLGVIKLSARTDLLRVANEGNDGQSVRIAIVGKPNVGKSSLFNKILNDERVVVSPVPGTTRTAIDSTITINNLQLTFIDTAGLWRKAKKQAEPEKFASFQVYKSIRRSDVVFLVLDGSEDLTHQDLAIAQEIISQEKGCVILVNKMDIVFPSPLGRGVRGEGPAGEEFKNQKSTCPPEPWRRREVKITNQNSKFSEPTKRMIDTVRYAFPQLWMCPIFLVSAVTGEGIQEAIATANEIFERRRKEISQEQLELLLSKRMKINPPKRLKDQKAPKVYSLSQVGTNPPAFELLVNAPSAIQEQFKRALNNALIKDLDFYGTPVKLLVRKKI